MTIILRDIDQHVNALIYDLAESECSELEMRKLNLEYRYEGVLNMTVRYDPLFSSYSIYREKGDDIIILASLPPSLTPTIKDASGGDIYNTSVTNIVFHQTTISGRKALITFEFI